MCGSYPLVIGDNGRNQCDFDEFGRIEPIFLLKKNNRQLRLENVNASVLNFLVISIIRKPKSLIIHLQRIILCYEQESSDRLYAALVDFFVVLKGKGLSIKQRVLAASRKSLSPVLRQRLQIYLTDHHLIQGNDYTVLTSGIESHLDMVILAPKEEVSMELDSLQIARDYIEYSQLEEAREVLESAIVKTPKYTELHVDLLELYKLTNNSDAFYEMNFVLSEIDHPMQAEWDTLNSFFSE